MLFNCNNFFHTAANCHIKPRCLKCGKNHTTRNCLIKERQENPFCINCQNYGHSACYTKCPKFPQSKKGTPFADPKKKRNFAAKWIKEGISFANVVSGEVPNQTPIEDKKEDSLRGFLSQDNNNTSDLTQILELFHIISNLKKKPKILDLYYLNLKTPTQMKKKPAFLQKQLWIKFKLYLILNFTHNNLPKIFP
ncbi:uncharacterized protein TNCV_849771 [Trichonephila clavipes]|nr:uncharacterized protein TNCV_849771 [Trichonephila clavipes]